MNFDESSKRLQEIVKQLEENKISLEEATKLYEEGVSIAKDCYGVLDNARGRVAILQKELEEIIENKED